MSRPLSASVVLVIAGLAACAPPSPALHRSPLTGKDGGKTVAGTEIVNRYTALSAAANAGDTTLTVADPTGLSAGDLILLVAAQGASIDVSDTATYGSIASFGAAGGHELWVLSAVAGSTLTLDLGCAPGGLQNSYPLTAAPQVVRIPQYTTLTVPLGTTLTGAAWNGATGGFVAVHVESTAILSGTIDASGLGFRGGAVSLASNTIVDDVTSYRDTATTGGEKGEGIAGDQAAYDGLGGRYGRGAPANGGGGGNGYLGGGGGGAGVDAAAVMAYSGEGTMSGAVTGGAAWNLDPGFASAGGPGGGRGGYTLSALDQDALTIAPGIPAWAGNGRNERGGLGGHPLVAPSRLFLGGGGGAGHYDSGALPASPAGASGGGVVYLMAGAISGSGAIHADGAHGRDGTIVGTNDVATIANGGGAGGGGAGGMVILRATGSPSIAVSASGGAGGDVALAGTFAPGISAASGPGGGGAGGGVLFGTGLTLAAPALVTGGAGGSTSAPALTEFPSNGGSAGDNGTNVSGVSQSAPPAACLPADLSITLVDSADPVDVSTGYSYTATVANAGPNAAYDLTETITLPAGVTVGVISAPGWSCNVASLTVTCTSLLLLSGTMSTIQVAVTAPASPAAITATATIASREDPIAGNNSANAGTTVQFPRADLDLNLAGPVATAAGEPFTYTLTVHNGGPRVAPSVSVLDTLPAGVTFLSFGGGSGGWSCTPSGGTVTCTHGSLAIGATASVDLSVAAPAFTSPTAVSNSGVVSIASAGTVDPVSGNNADAVGTTITPVDLSITKTDLIDPVTASGAITYTITVTNPAGVVAHGVVVNDPLPAGTALVAASGSGWACALVVSTVHCTRASIAAAPTLTAPITVVLTAPSTQGVIANTATVSATATDPSLANNTATEQTTISPPAPGSADLSITISDAPDPVDLGATLSYTLTIANAGPDPAAGVQMLASLPSGAGFVSATGTGWSCVQGSSTVTCSRMGTLAVGMTPPISITLTAPSTPGLISASAVITASTPDPIVGNDAATENTTVIDPTLLNQPPTLALPAMLSTLEDNALVLADAMAPAIADPDAGGAIVELRVTGANCLLSLSRVDGLALRTGDGVLDPELVARGTIADLNAALDRATLTPDRNYFGTAQLQFTVDDLGNTGAGGAKQVSALLDVTVLPVDDPPSAADDAATISIDAGPTRIDVLANDSSGDIGQAIHVVSVTAPAHGLSSVTATGDAVTYTPSGTFVGADSFQYTLSDGNSQVSATVSVQVVAPPQPTDVHLGGAGYGCSVPGRRAGDATGVLALVLLLFVRVAARKHARV